MKDGIAAIVPGKPKESELLTRILSTDEDEVMPPPKSHKKKLSAEEVAMLTRWIEAGAPWGKHWAFEKPEKVALPRRDADTSVRGKAPPADRSVRVTHAVDAFVSARLAKEGLAMSKEAPRHTLARRAAFDLTGLPPSPEALATFEKDTKPGAYGRYVDSLLASSHYGERMAMWWLDAARYSDTDGFQADATRTNWPWRDWVIESFNANMRFDQFTIGQFAGDLLPNATPEQKLATCFHRNHMTNGEGGRDPEESRIDYVLDRVNTVGTVWLANIGRFRISATDQAGSAVHSVETAPLEELAKREADTPVRTLEPRTGVAAPLIDAKLRAKLFDQFIADYAPYQVEQSALDRANRQLSEVQAAAKKLNVMVLAERKEPRDTHGLVRGVWDKKGDKVPRGVLASVGAPALGEDTSRVGLARWLVSRENPLTARVMVNNLRGMLFGAGIVRTPEDFGLQGERPTHPELLDWLAVEFMESGWDVKHLLKLIVTSATYRQDSAVSEALLARDPENRLLARGARFRLPAWMLRDTALANSGLLNRALGGPPVMPYQPDGVWEEIFMGRFKYERSEGAAQYRRTLYAFWRLSIAPTFLFDSAQRRVCEVRTPRTNTPLQALTLLNDRTMLEASHTLAAQAEFAAPNHERVVEQAAAFQVGDERGARLVGVAAARGAPRCEPAVMIPVRGVAGQGQWDSPEAGRDHHPRCFTMWLAGGGVKRGITHGATDDFSYNVAENPVHVHDLHATILHLLGIHHERLTFRHQGLDFRLTGVEKASVVRDILI